MKTKKSKYEIYLDDKTLLELKVGSATLIGNRVTFRLTEDGKQGLKMSRDQRKNMTMLRQMVKLLGHTGKRKQITIIASEGARVTILFQGEL